MPYYMAGGFFSRIAHKVGHAAGVVGHAVVAANTKPWAFLISGGKTTDLKAAAILATSVHTAEGTELTDRTAGRYPKR